MEQETMNLWARSVARIHWLRDVGLLETVMFVSCFLLVGE